MFSSCRVRRSSSDELNESGGQMSSGTAPLIIPYLDRLCRRLFHFTRSSLNVIRSTRISTHTGVTLLRLDRLALASHLLRAHTHARASTIISSSWSRRPSSSHGKILVASFSPATFCKKKKEFCNMKYSSHYSELCELSSRYVSRRRRKKGKKSSKLLLDIIDILVGGGREKRFVFFSKCSKEFDNSIIFLCACVYFVIFF